MQPQYDFNMYPNNQFGAISPMNLYPENSSKRSLDLDYTVSQIVGREDCPQHGKKNSAVRLTSLSNLNLNLNQEEAVPDPFEDLDREEDSEYEGCQCGGTKPCLTNKDFQSLADLNREIDEDLPQIPIIKADKEDSKPNEEMNEKEVSSLPQTHLASNEEEKDEPESLQIRQPAIMLQTNVERSGFDNLSVDSMVQLHSKKIQTIAKQNDESKKSTKDSFEWNNFLVRRACFRGISEFYKNKFAKINTSWQRKRVNKKKKTPMDVLIKSFATDEFGSVAENVTDEQWAHFKSTLYSLLFSHRYKKRDDFLEGVDFELIRGVLYSYTTEKRVELLSNPFFSVIVLNFLKKGREVFLQEKIRNKPQLYAEELKAELDALEEEAKGNLSQFSLAQELLSDN